MAKNLNDKHILEWGAGQSTLWWAKRAKSVLAFESSPEWHRYITQAAPANAQVYFTHDTIDDVDQHLVAEGFDIIVIDGLDRYKCAVKSINLISKDGAIILDNSDGFWGKEGEYPIIDFLRRNGFQRIDFYGYPAGVIQPHCTSIFFKSDCFLLTGREYPMRHC
ncbi:MAG: hypothetical protein HYR55_17705 [Acidobacteria bacterium]|nr:hypothetical protein [Acidobacteriota bacterium]MBI3658031.1 hypothetical protein [Acidobacteriota bacterium]